MLESCSIPTVVNTGSAESDVSLILLNVGLGPATEVLEIIEVLNAIIMSVPERNVTKAGA